MLTKYVQEGHHLDYTPSAPVGVGDIVVQGDLLGIAPRAIGANERGTISVCGVFEIPKATIAGSAIAAGTKVYWDVAEKIAKPDDESGANKLIGKTVLPAVDGDATVRVRLSQ